MGRIRGRSPLRSLASFGRGSSRTASARSSVESLAAGRLRHGAAVAMGLVAECRAARVDPAVTARVEALLRALGAATEVPEDLRDARQLWERAKSDKKATRGDAVLDANMRDSEYYRHYARIYNATVDAELATKRGAAQWASALPVRRAWPPESPTRAECPGPGPSATLRVSNER